MPGKKHWTRQPFSKKGVVNVMIETSKGRRNKMKYEPAQKCFVLHKVLPAGSTFPYDFGFVPNTKAEDGDPIDVLVLMDESVDSGSLVPSRVIGVIQAEEARKDQVVRNDRILAVAVGAHDYRDLKTIDDVNDRLLEELEHFFTSYHELEGAEFRCKGFAGPDVALALIRRSIEE